MSYARVLTVPNSNPREILIEGYSEDEILRLPLEEIRELAPNRPPVVLRIGSASVLGEFLIETDKLRLELAHIDGGGEGVLLMLGALARRFAMLNGIREIEWVVHAVHCATPNLKLRRVLEGRGFVAGVHAGVDVYRLTQTLA